MKRIYFKCTFLTDIVISAKTATEGEHQSLNFIPGSKFLGILASSVYDKVDPTMSYLLFHSGKVRYGDAHIVCNGSRSLQVPFSWYFPKGGKLTENENYMLNFFNNDNFKNIVNKGIILKQAREGYFTENGKYLSLNKEYAQKTAYDSDKRHAKEKNMFGYEALQKGSEWQFCIDIDDNLLSDEKSIIGHLNALTGKKRLGRSKTAEFGSVVIENIIKDNEDIKNETIKPQKIKIENRIVKNGEVSYETKLIPLVFLYAESRLAFHNRFGQSTFTPTPEQLGLPENVTILWERSQVRTGVYAPWNYKRNCRDEDRVFIEKGSVLIVNFEDVNDFDTGTINSGVGLYRTEGFGKLLINPGFLNFDPESGKLNLQLETASPSNEADEETTPPDSDLIKWIEQQNDSDVILKRVDDFMESHAQLYSKVTRSQWGKIRSYAMSATDKNKLLTNLFADSENGNMEGFLTHGVALEQWKNGKKLLQRTITDMADSIVLQFVEKLGSRMQKKGGAK